jgi:NAD(P)H-dependent flavin oxidoreductase YrpB (nitropropane dioxygenase family)
MTEPALLAFLNARLRLPVMVAPMFLISGPDLVIAAGKAGLSAQGDGCRGGWADPGRQRRGWPHRPIQRVRLCGGGAAVLERAADPRRRHRHSARRARGADAWRRCLAQMLGADWAYMGTRFIAARESLVSDANHETLVRAAMRDVVTTSAITGVPANWMRESLETAGFTAEMLKGEKKIDFSNLHGNTKAWKNIWGAGHSVGRTRAIQSVAEIVDELVEEDAELDRFGIGEKSVLF